MTVRWLNKWKWSEQSLHAHPISICTLPFAEFKRHRALRDLYKLDFYCKHSFCKCTEKETRVWKLESYKKRKETKDTRGQREEKKKDDSIYFLFRAVNKNISTNFLSREKKKSEVWERESEATASATKWAGENKNTEGTEEETRLSGHCYWSFLF